MPDSGGRAPLVVDQDNAWTSVLLLLIWEQESPDLALEYGLCSEQLDQQSLGRLDALTDSSFAPAGGRGHQGIMAMWGGYLVAWESKFRAFATLSTTESELLGYIDGFTLGKSVGAVVNALHQNVLETDGAFTLGGITSSCCRLPPVRGC